MAAPKFNLLAVVLLCSCAQVALIQDLIIDDQTGGCFTTSDSKVKRHNEMLVLEFAPGEAAADSDCRCKSASIGYASFEIADGVLVPLLTGEFSALSEDPLALPIAKQVQGPHEDKSLVVKFTCTNPAVPQAPVAPYGMPRR